MSYDVDLVDANGDVLPCREHFEEGGTRVLGGISECSLNITYNYSEVFGPLVRGLHGCLAERTVADLMEFVAQWPNTKPYERDYWAPTPGNAVAAIQRLLVFAQEHPTGTWRIS